MSVDQLNDVDLGPADPFLDDDPSAPHRFRTTYRRQRWYIDPLPTCELAEATDERWPSLSAVKRAWTTHFSKRWDDGNVYDLDPLRVAKFVDENMADLAAMPSAQRIPAMALSARLDLNAAANRGTGVHAAIESLMAGDEALAAKVCPPAYWTTVQRLIAEMAPIVLHAERVAINRRLGIAGTFDIMVATRFGNYLVDWKSRGADSNHGSYPGEAAQLGGYGGADYLIDAIDGAPKRIRLPELAGGLVVSIKPDSYEAYPIDLPTAIEACTQMHAAWRLQSTGQSAARKATGKSFTFAAPVEDPAPRGAATEPGAALPSDPEAAAPDTQAPTVSDGSATADGHEDGGLSTAGGCSGSPATVPDGTNTEPARIGDLLPATVLELRTRWIQARLATLAASTAARQLVAEGWPATGTPTAPPWTDHQIDALDELLTAVETTVEAPFPVGDPSKPTAEEELRAERQARQAAAESEAAANAPSPDWFTPEEGGPADPAHVEALLAQARALSPVALERASSWINQAKRLNRPFGTVTDGTWSARCLAVNTAMHAVLATTWEDDETEHVQVLHALTEIATGHRCQPSWLPGPLLGSLTIDQAKSLTDTATAFAAGDPQTSTAVVEIVTRAA